LLPKTEKGVEVLGRGRADRNSRPHVGWQLLLAHAPPEQHVHGCCRQI
jgi:hypothetical protein